MARRNKRRGSEPRTASIVGNIHLREAADQYNSARELALDARHDNARELYAKLSATTTDQKLRATIANDLAALDAIVGNLDSARQRFESALAIDPDCEPARLNIALLQSEPTFTASQRAAASNEESQSRNLEIEPEAPSQPPRSIFPSVSQPRIAIVSLLFNWPSTGGGNIHTVELAHFLGRAGYQVKHFYARYPEWGIGNVHAALPIVSEALEFDARSWSRAPIQSSLRSAVDRFAPDYVIIADSWNMKPILAEALADYPYLLRFQAQECLCPLNNLRLLASSPSTVQQCPQSQLATPEACRKCLRERGHLSGALHQWERDLAGVGTAEYESSLRRSLQDAEAVLALNPLVGAMLEPFARRVRVVPWGMDPARFPWVPEGQPGPDAENRQSVLFMAAVAGEFIKGAHIADQACRILRQTRSDFELVTTSDPPGRVNEFTRSVGWCTQADLPRHYRNSDICLVPTIAQDGLSRTSVEAMASGVPVVASKIGGLPFTVLDGVTGMLAEPGNPDDLAHQIAKLLDNPTLRRQMGTAGRRRFEEEFTWESVINRYYRPLLSQSVTRNQTTA